jgi:hypothetical protein
MYCAKHPPKSEDSRKTLLVLRDASDDLNPFAPDPVRNNVVAHPIFNATGNGGPVPSTGKRLLIHPTVNGNDNKRKWIQTRSHSGRLPR